MEKLGSDVDPIAGVKTSTVGFIGMTKRGKITGMPEFVESYGEFRQKFGGYLPRDVYKERRYLPMAVEQFFANGGKRCCVVRLLSAEHAATASKTAAGITFFASSPGTWGNSITILVSQNQCGKGLYTFQVDCLDQQGSGIQQELFSDVSLDPASDRYICKAFEASLLVTVTHTPASAENGSATQREGNKTEQEKPGILAALIRLFSQLIRLRAKKKPVAPEARENANLDATPDYAESASDPASGQAESERSPAAQQTAESLLAQLIKADPVMRLEGGYDHKDDAKLLDTINADLLKGNDGGAGHRSGLAALCDAVEVSIVAAPGVTDDREITEIISHCERMKNRICILDMPSGESDVETLKDYRAQIDSARAAMYYPWIEMPGSPEENPVIMPPSGALAGVYARTDDTRGVHKAPANEGIRNCTGVQLQVTQSQQEALGSVGINMIRNVQTQGILVWGARTCSSDSNCKYINISRLLIYIEQSIRQGIAGVDFGESNAFLRERERIAAFLYILWRDGVLMGTSPGDAFFVREENLSLEIGVALMRAEEFVVIHIVPDADCQNVPTKME